MKTRPEVLIVIKTLSVFVISGLWLLCLLTYLRVTGDSLSVISNLVSMAVGALAAMLTTTFGRGQQDEDDVQKTEIVNTQENAVPTEPQYHEEEAQPIPLRQGVSRKPADMEVFNFKTGRR